MVAVAGIAGEMAAVVGGRLPRGRLQSLALARKMAAAMVAAMVAATLAEWMAEPSLALLSRQPWTSWAVAQGRLLPPKWTAQRSLEQRA